MNKFIVQKEIRLIYGQKWNVFFFYSSLFYEWKMWCLTIKLMNEIIKLCVLHISMRRLVAEMALKQYTTLVSNVQSWPLKCLFIVNYSYLTKGSRTLLFLSLFLMTREIFAKLSCFTLSYMFFQTNLNIWHLNITLTFPKTGCQ